MPRTSSTASPTFLNTNIGVDLLYKNNGNGTFTEVSACLAACCKVVWHTGAAFGDFDGDGNLDLFISGYVDIHSISLNEPAPLCSTGIAAFCGPIGLKGERGILYHNNGNGTFTDVTVKAGLGNVKPSHGFTVVMDDFNQDGRTDILRANDQDPQPAVPQQRRWHIQGGSAGARCCGEYRCRVNQIWAAVGDVQNQGHMA